MHSQCNNIDIKKILHKYTKNKLIRQCVEKFRFNLESSIISASRKRCKIIKNIA